MDIITRQQALEQGLTHYFTGKPCKYGHLAPRYPAQGHCVECTSIRMKAKNARRAQTKIPVECPSCGKTRLRSGTSIGQSALLVNICRSCAGRLPKDRSGPNAGRFVKDMGSPRNIALANGESRYHGAPCRHGHGTERYARDGKCVQCVADRAAVRGARWAAENRGKVAATAAKRRAVKALATPPWLTEDDFAAMEAMYVEAERISSDSGVPHEVDHIIPLQGKTVCGFHCPQNLRIITRSANRMKCNKFDPARLVA